LPRPRRGVGGGAWLKTTSTARPPSSPAPPATARALAAGGANVALLARRADRVERLAGELGGDAVKAVAIEADVTDRDSMQAAAQRVADELGSVDILVNNAGQMLLAPFTPDHSEETRRMVETNLLGAMTTLEVFLEQLRDGGGDLVNISSVAGRTAKPGSSVYNATKWGLNGWSEALRQELQGRDIRVIVIEPGAIATELPDHISHEKSKQGAEKMYAELAIPAEDVADVIVFAVAQPARTSLNEILIRPTKQAL
jgi:NADP-dependent 3-hydroxy acid dehydrogenase YdfG